MILPFFDLNWVHSRYVNYWRVNSGLMRKGRPEVWIAEVFFEVLFREGIGDGKGMGWVLGVVGKERIWRFVKGHFVLFCCDFVGGKRGKGEPRLDSVLGWPWR